MRKPVEGIKVEVRNLTGLKKSFTVTCEHWDTIPPTDAHNIPSNLRDPIYFDVSIKGVTKGDAILSITHDSVTLKHRIQHHDTKTHKWVNHRSSVKGKTVSAKFKVSQLHKTPVSIGH